MSDAAAVLPVFVKTSPQLRLGIAVSASPLPTPVLAAGEGVTVRGGGRVGAGWGGACAVLGLRPGAQPGTQHASSLEPSFHREGGVQNWLRGAEVLSPGEGKPQGGSRCCEPVKARCVPFASSPLSVLLLFIHLPPPPPPQMCDLSRNRCCGLGRSQNLGLSIRFTGPFVPLCALELFSVYLFCFLNKYYYLARAEGANRAPHWSPTRKHIFTSFPLRCNSSVRILCQYTIVMGPLTI